MVLWRFFPLLSCSLVLGQVVAQLSGYMALLYRRGIVVLQNRKHILGGKFVTCELRDSL
jgi:hypothetical protein